MADNELRRRRLKIIQVLLLVDDLDDEKGRNRERIIWTRSWIRRREERWVYHQLIRELALEDEPAFARYFRMDKNKFDDLVLSLPVFDLGRLSSVTLGTYPTTQVSSHRTVRVFAFRHHLIEPQV